MTWTVRELGEADVATAQRLGWEAFGAPAGEAPPPPPLHRPGRHWFGAFADERLAAQLIDREYESYFGGVAVSTAGIASVSVGAESRGQGALTPLFATALREAKRRGAVISTLFPTAPGIYRRFGYEVIADYATVSVPTSVLAGVLPAPGVTTRRATAVDVAEVRKIYDRWAIEQNGPLTRRGVSFPLDDQGYLDGFTGVTVAEDASGVCGYASWNRGQGYGEQAKIAVTDLLAHNQAGYRALLRLVGSFASVAVTTEIDTSGDDLARLFLPTLHWQVVGSAPYMLKILDVPGALAARRYPAGLSVELSFALEDDFLTENNGAYAVHVAVGRARCEPTEEADRTFTAAGLTLSYAGVQSAANLRAAGQLRGGRAADDPDWDALFSGRQQHIRNYF